MEEAERMMLEHEAAAEYHGALAAMYRDRIERLNGYMTLSAPSVEIKFPNIEESSK